MATNYPGSLDTFTDPMGTDYQSVVPHSVQHSHANDSIAAVQSTLGVNPQGISATVRARLDAMTLVPTGVKTGNYTAAPSDFIPVDLTSAAVTVTLPTAPADRTRIGVKLIIGSGSRTVTIATGGSDVFNKAGGSTTLTLTLVNQAVILQYSTTGAIWFVVSDDLSLAQLDLRYITALQGAGLFAPLGTPGWTPSTAYAAGQLVIYSSTMYAAKNAFTSGGSFDGATYWYTVGSLASLDTTLAHLQPPGIAALGSAGLAADGGHVHPFATWQPADSGLLTWAFDGSLAAASTILASGTIVYAKVKLSAAATITNLLLHVATAGSTLTAGQSFAALYDSTGATLLGTSADQSTAFASAGLKVIPLGTPYVAAAGVYTVAVWSVGTTPPTLARGTGNAPSNAGTTGSASRYGTAGSATTTAPASLTMTAAQTAWWVALS